MPFSHLLLFQLLSFLPYTHTHIYARNTHTHHTGRGREEGGKEGKEDERKKG
jgi:hypothetical protein